MKHIQTYYAFSRKQAMQPEEGFCEYLRTQWATLQKGPSLWSRSHCLLPALENPLNQFKFPIFFLWIFNLNVLNAFESIASPSIQRGLKGLNQ